MEKIMKETTMKEYNDIKTLFYRKHATENGIHESGMIDEYGRIHKNVYFNDGAEWHEVSEKIREEATTTVNIHGIAKEVATYIDLFRTEYFNTDNSESRYMYEVY